MQKLLSAVPVVLLVFLFCTSIKAQSFRDIVNTYDSVNISESVVERSVADSYATMVNSFGPVFRDEVVIDKTAAKPRLRHDKTSNFYMVLFSILLFGGVRFVNPKYFQNLFKALRSPMLTNQQLKDQMGSAVLVNWAMNIFFAVTAGLYAYLLVGVFSSQRSAVLYPSMLLPVLIAVVMLIYIVKYFVLKFSGWAFNVQSIIDSYLFNVYLVNKVMAIALLPFLVLIAFADTAVVNPIAIMSFIVLGALLLYRYIRSWQVFGAFFKYSRFHFFMYLCASEILPVAVLTKVLVRVFY